MQRRTLLAKSAALGTVALAGCLSSGDGDPAGTPTETPSPTPEPPSMGETTVEGTAGGCVGEDYPEAATVSFLETQPSVRIDGALRAPNPCHVAALESANYDADGDELTVTVAAEDDGDGMCQQCLAGIDYTATVPFDGGLPGTVVVRHGSGEDATEIKRAQP